MAYNVNPSKDKQRKIYIRSTKQWVPVTDEVYFEYYAIGKADPVAVAVTSFGTSKFTDGQLSESVRSVFNLRLAAIIEKLRLRNAIYEDTAA